MVELKARDRVSVSGTVKGCTDSGVLIEFDGYVKSEVGYTKIEANKVTLVQHYFEVDDRIYSDDEETVGNVLAVVGEWLWVQPDNGRAPRSIEAKYCHHDSDDALEPLLKGSD